MLLAAVFQGARPYSLVQVGQWQSLAYSINTIEILQFHKRCAVSITPNFFFFYINDTEKLKSKFHKNCTWALFGQLMVFLTLCLRSHGSNTVLPNMFIGQRFEPDYIKKELKRQSWETRICAKVCHELESYKFTNCLHFQEKQTQKVERQNIELRIS